MPEISPPPIDAPIIDKTTGKLSADWIKWISELTTKFRVMTSP